MLVHTVNVWIWASAFILVGAFDALEPALYFTLVSFSTVGFGDITLGHEWRLLSASLQQTASSASAGRRPIWWNW